MYDKSTLLRALALLRQVEQSLMAVLWPTQRNWDGLREYFANERGADLDALAASFPNTYTFTYKEATAVAEKYSSHPIWSLVRGVSNRLSRRLSLSSGVRRLIGFCFHRMLYFLESPRQPDVELLIDFRLAVTTAFALLHGNLVGVNGLKEVHQIEYLGHHAPAKALAYREIFPATSDADGYRKAG